MMYSPVRLALKYLSFYRNAANRDGHGVHSPFLFDFIKNVLPEKAGRGFDKIESIRKELLADKTTIPVKDFGAGSAVIKTNERIIKKMAGSSLKSKKVARLLYRIANHFQPSN